MMQSTAHGVVAEVAPNATAAQQLGDTGGGGVTGSVGPGGGSSDPSAAGAPRPALAAVALLRAATARSRRGVARALAEGAADALLDEAETAPPALAAACLACLADLVREHPAAALPHLRAWCSDTDGAPALAVLLRLWRDEETRLQVVRGPHGEIDLGRYPESIQKPLSVSVGSGPRGGGRASAGGSGGFALTSTGVHRSDAGGINGAGGGAGSAFGRLRDALRASKLWAAADGAGRGSGSIDGV